MIDIFLQGGVLTMSLLTFLLICVVIASSKKQKIIKALGLLAFIVGSLSAALGLYSAFSVIEQVGNAMIAQANASPQSVLQLLQR